MMSNCAKCPDMTILDNPRGIGCVVYTGGPPDAPFQAVGRAIPADDGLSRKYARPQVTKEGLIQYDPMGPEPPIPEGYAPSTDPWTLRPIWPSCVFRSLRVSLHEDGHLQIEGQCLNPASGKRGYETVTAGFCEGCETRISIQQATTPSTLRRELRDSARR
jgi:hypothetical protein